MAEPERRRTCCGGDCPSCLGAEAEAAAPSGGRLVGWAAVAFLMPLGLAIAGAALGGASATGRFLGAAGGLTAGLAAAGVAGRFAAAKADKESR